MANYYASKAYVLSFSEAMWEEARGTGVHVSCLCPGPTVSKFRERAGTGKTQPRPGEASRRDAVRAGRAHGLRGVEAQPARHRHRRAQRVPGGLVKYIPRETLLKMVRNVQSPAT